MVFQMTKYRICKTSHNTKVEIKIFFNLVLVNHKDVYDDFCSTRFLVLNRILKSATWTNNFENIEVPDLLDNIIVRLMTILDPVERRKLLSNPTNRKFVKDLHSFFFFVVTG